jgi:hypothetical protein
MQARLGRATLKNRSDVPSIRRNQETNLCPVIEVAISDLLSLSCLMTLLSDLLSLDTEPVTAS